MAQVPDVATRWRIAALTIGVLLVVNATAQTYQLYFKESDLERRVKDLERTAKLKDDLIIKWMPPDVKKTLPPDVRADLGIK